MWGGILLIIVNVFPQLSTFKHILESSLFFWDDSVSAKNDVSGSSVAYRAFQMKKTMELVSDSPMFGNGWGSCYYRNLHSDMNGWESIVFTTLMQFGYLGFIIWGNMFYRFYHFSLKSRQMVISLAFMMSSMAFCILNDTIYPFYIFFGAVLINKLSYFGIKSNNKVVHAKNRFTNHFVSPFSHDSGNSIDSFRSGC